MDLYGVNYQFWPPLTNATASSVHSPVNGECFQAQYTIDNNVNTFWNGNTETDQDWLKITLPPGSPTDLKGLLVVSRKDGWIVDYFVEVVRASRTDIAARKTNITDFFSVVNFDTDGSMANGNAVVTDIQSISIVVNNRQRSSLGQFSRIAEVYPIYASSSQSMNSTMGAGGNNGGSSVGWTGHISAAALAGIILGSVLALLIIAFVLVASSRRRRSKETLEKRLASPQYDPSEYSTKSTSSQGTRTVSMRQYHELAG